MRIVCWNTQRKQQVSGYVAGTLLQDHARLSIDVLGAIEPIGTGSYRVILEGDPTPDPGSQDGRGVLARRCKGTGLEGEKEDVLVFWRNDSVNVMSQVAFNDAMRSGEHSGYRVPLAFTVTDRRPPGNSYVVAFWHAAPPNKSEANRTAFNNKFCKVSEKLGLGVGLVLGDFNSTTDTGWGPRDAPYVLAGPPRHFLTMVKPDDKFHEGSEIFDRVMVRGVGVTRAGRVYGSRASDGDLAVLPANFGGTYSDHVPVYADVA